MSDMRLLVIDDDAVFRTRLVRALKERNVDVSAAADADEAMTIVRTSLPTHALVDLRLGSSDGIDLVRALRALGPDMTIVVLTGYGSIVTAVEAVHAGATNYLTKPADAEQILATLRGEGPEGQQGDVPSLARVEWEHMQRVLSDCDGNISEAARRLGLHRRSLQRKLAKYPPNR
jgi:two-component system response regulator RegA